MKRSVLFIGVICMGAACAYAIHPAENEAQKGKAEKPDPATKKLAAADTNGDGFVSLDEFKALEAQRLEARKQKMGDKFDPAKEAKRPSVEERFNKLDKDGDGKLSKEEFAGPVPKAGPKGERPDKAKMLKERPDKKAKAAGDIVPAAAE